MMSSAGGGGGLGGSSSDGNSNNLGLKMSQLTMMSNYNNSNNQGGPPGMSGSTVSTSSIDDRPHPHDSSIDHSSVAGSFKGSQPSSPSPEMLSMGGSSGGGSGLSRPPGLMGGLPNLSVAGSPIVGGLPGHHSKNSSATSPMLTLTPNSSVDGNNDLYGGRQASSPFPGGGGGSLTDSTGPTMPFLRNDSQRGDVNGEYGGNGSGGGIANFGGSGGSFDLVDTNDNDGLLGLDALRDRAYSSPGPMARSFESAPSLRGGLPPSSRGGGGGGTGGGSVARDTGGEGRSRRGVSRDNSGRSSSSARPPLSGANNNPSHSPRSGRDLGSMTNAATAGDMSPGGLVVPFPPSGGRSGDPSPTRPIQASTKEAASSSNSLTDYSTFGAIGRPEFSGNAREWEPSNRRRSIAGMEPNVNVTAPRPDYGYANEQQPEYEPSRRRSIGTESGREFFPQHQQQQQHHQQQQGQGHHQQHQQYQQQQQQQQGYGKQQYHSASSGYGGSHAEQLPDHTVSHKFGVLPSMGSHMQQQLQHKERMPPQQQQHYNPMMIPQPKHQRSFSQPGPRSAPSSDHLGMDGTSAGRYQASSAGRMEESNNSGAHYPREPPRYIGAPPPQQQQQPRHVRQHSGDSFRSAQSRRSASMSHGSLSVNSYDGGGGGGGGMPGHKRNSQPNLGAGGYYGQQQHQQALPNMHPSMQHRMEKQDHYDPNGHQRRHTSYEDDLTLLGEHIEVPADHGMEDPYAGGYGGGGSGYRGGMRAQMAPPEAMAPHYSGYEGQQIHHLPTAGAALPPPKIVFNVKFKRTQRSFVLGPRIQRDLKVGTYVKVEADRGEDLGIVIGRVPTEKCGFSGRTTFRSQSMGGISDATPSPTGLSPPGATDLKCIIRLATHEEVSLLTLKRDEEEELLTICRTKVRQRALPMNVVDAEYQFDRHKLTFFFEAEGRIDFRELVRDLFSMYKTRIWMQQLDKHNCSTAGGTSQPPPNNMIDYGTPIIAPVSEFGEFGLPGAN